VQANHRHFYFLRSYLPQAGPAPSFDFLPDGSATPTAAPTAAPLYLPTTENPSNYQTVVVERKVSVQLPPPPQKEPGIIELEVMISIFGGLSQWWLTVTWRRQEPESSRTNGLMSPLKT